MAQAIVYCDKCGNMVPPGELDRGRALVGDDVAVCETCAASLTPAQREAIKRRIWGATPEPRGSGRAPRRTQPPTAARPRARPARRTEAKPAGRTSRSSSRPARRPRGETGGRAAGNARRTGLVFAAAGAGTLMVIAVVFLVTAGPSKRPDRKPPTALPASGRRPPAPGASAPRDDRSAPMSGEARTRVPPPPRDTFPPATVSADATGPRAAASSAGAAKEATTEIESGLVLHWNLDEDGGTVARDSSGGGHDGKLAGGPTWRPGGGAMGGALEFDGEDDCVVDEDGEEFLNRLPNISISVRVKVIEITGDRGFLTGSEASHDHNIFMRVDPSGASGKGTNVVKMGVNTTTGHYQYESASGQIVPGAWRHYVLVWRTGEAMKLYADGALDSPTNGTIRGIPGGSTSGNNTFVVGALGLKDGKGRNGFRGLVDDVRVYDRALTQADVKALQGLASTSSHGD